ncbi:MAG: hypothetical protein JNL76_08235 [Alphaproteobacteria bacterium]|nr:hypothetical protein [Alphaproteobacteria bacterium]
MENYVASAGGIMVPTDGNAKVQAHNSCSPDSDDSLSPRHTGIIAHADLSGLMAKLAENHTPPKILVLTCTDYRISASDFFNLPPGKAFIQKQVGGFLTRNLSAAAAFHASLAVAAGIKEVQDIFIMTHSDCAAAKIAVQFPKEGMVPQDMAKNADIETIQRYVLQVSDKIPWLSRIFYQMQNGGHPLPAEDLMAAHLGIESYKNLMGIKLFHNQTRTTSEMVDMGQVRVSLLHLDLGKKSKTNPDLYERMPALYEYDPITGQFFISRRCNVSDFDGVGLNCGYHEITPMDGAITDASEHLQIKYSDILLAP